MSDWWIGMTKTTSFENIFSHWIGFTGGLTNLWMGLYVYVEMHYNSDVANNWEVLNQTQQMNI